jgi:prefoldin alpha subunit
MEEQDNFMQLQMLDSHYRETAQQIEIVEQELEGLSEFLHSLEHLSKSNEKKMLSPLGRGIFMPADRRSEKLFVDVGAGVFVRKSVSDTLLVVKEQLSRLNEIHTQLKTQESFYASQLQALMEQAEKAKEE